MGRKKIKSVVKPDFGDEYIDIGLLVPSYIDGPQDNSLRVSSARITRLYGPDLKKYNESLRLLASNSDTAKSTHGFVSQFFELARRGVTSFFDANGDEIKSASPIIVLKQVKHYNLFKLMFFITAMTRESSYTTSAYPCQNRDPMCTNINEHKHDPELPMPDNVDPRKETYMEDIFDNYKEILLEDAMSRDDLNFSETGFFVDLDRGPTLKLPVSKEDKKHKEIVATKYEFDHPTIGDFINAEYYKEYSRYGLSDFDSYVYFKNIRSINGLSEEETEEIKNLNGAEVVMRLRKNDFGKITEHIDAVTSYIDNHSETCLSCGFEYDTATDITNFFVSLSS